MANLVRKLQGRVGAGQFDIYNFLEECSLNMICGKHIWKHVPKWDYKSMVLFEFLDTTFGTKFNPEDTSNAEFLEAANMYDIR